MTRDVEQRGLYYEELEPDVAGRQLLRRDPGPDDHGDEQASAEDLGEEPAGEGRHVGAGHVAMLTQRHSISQT